MATMAWITRDGMNIMFASGVVLEEGRTNTYRHGKRHYLTLAMEQGVPTITCSAKDGVIYKVPLDEDGDYCFDLIGGERRFSDEEAAAHAAAQREQTTRNLAERQAAIVRGETHLRRLRAQGCVKKLHGSTQFVADETRDARSLWQTDGDFHQTGSRVTITNATWAIRGACLRVVHWDDPSNDLYYQLGRSQQERLSDTRLSQAS